MFKGWRSKIFWGSLALVALVVAGIFSQGLFYSAKTIHELLGESKELRQALENLTSEQQIGYVRVLKKERVDDILFTTISFTQTSPSSENEIISQHEYTFPGDVLYLDTLIVKFPPELVKDGKARALYLMRRMFGETIPPQEGMNIETFGKSPSRYAGLLDKLSLRDKTLFWSNIWELANDPLALEQRDIQAIYGNALYIKVESERIYYLKINTSGQIFPEVHFL